MLPNLPLYISLVFGLTTLMTLVLFVRVLKKSGLTRSTFRYLSVGLLLWLAMQAALGATGFYRDSTAVPPRLLFAIGPPFATIILLFSTRAGRRFIDAISLADLTWINAVRVPVELVLYWLFLYGTVPELMTFSGRNYDILVGLTAPLVAYFGLSRKYLSRRLLLLWNVLSLGLLLNIVTHGVLSAPTPFQQFAFEQPNIALLTFPFVWLPTLIVPVALLTHLVSIRRLALGTTTKPGWRGADVGTV